MRTGSGGVIAAIGRFLLALIFVLAGLEKIFGWSGELAYLTARGMPAPGFFLFVALVIELVVGLMLMFGIKTKFAASVLFLYLIPVTVVMHGFWNVTNPALHAVMEDMLIHFLKNISIMGGLLAVLGYEMMASSAQIPFEEESGGGGRLGGEGGSKAA